MKELYPLTMQLINSDKLSSEDRQYMIEHVQSMQKIYMRDYQNWNYPYLLIRYAHFLEMEIIIRQRVMIISHCR